VIRRLLVLGIGAVLGAVGLDRFLAARRGERSPEPIRSFAVIEAPADRVWAVVADVEAQPRWMTDMKAVRLLTPGPVGVGTRAEADVRIAGIGVTDPVTITEFDPPRRFAIRHEGAFKGTGVIELTPGADGRSTIVTWDETLVAPLLPELGGLVGRPLLGSVFQADLHRLRELIEGDERIGGGPAADAAASLAMEAEGGPPTPAEAAEARLPPVRVVSVERASDAAGAIAVEGRSPVVPG
jgi:uncharacterized protein YndB with AHSA1/START domain